MWESCFGLALVGVILLVVVLAVAGWIHTKAVTPEMRVDIADS